MKLQVKRVYDLPAATDGARVLVDRLWPRGLRMADAHVDLWLKNLAPSAPLRRWFGHDPARWEEFKRRYFDELGAHGDALSELLRQLDRGPVTLLFAARDLDYNNAVALREYVERQAAA
ncbi:MAG TPA: DUF488 family protein [Roseiflexaceae bacterium]